MFVSVCASHGIKLSTRLKALEAISLFGSPIKNWKNQNAF